MTRNSNRWDEVSARASGLEDRVEMYLKTHDVRFKLPVGGELTLGARNMDYDQLDLSLNFGSKGSVEGMWRLCSRAKINY